MDKYIFVYVGLININKEYKEKVVVEEGTCYKLLINFTQKLALIKA